MNDLRRVRVDVLVDGKWTDVEFKEIKAGDRFRLFRSTGEPVVDKNGKSEFIAKSDPYITKYYDGVYVIDI